MYVFSHKRKRFFSVPREKIYLFGLIRCNKFDILQTKHPLLNFPEWQTMSDNYEMFFSKGLMYHVTLRILTRVAGKCSTYLLTKV